MSIRANMISGGARLDLHNKTDCMQLIYVSSLLFDNTIGPADSEAEAKEAFERSRREHRW